MELLGLTGQDLRRKLAWGLVVQAAMRSILIVVLVPSPGPAPGVEQISKPRRVQELPSQPAVQAFAVGVLHRFAGSNVHNLNLLRDAPSLKLTAGELAAVIDANALRLAVFGDGHL